MKKNGFSSQAMRITWIGLWINVFMAVMKLIAGIYGKSRAVVADGVHSFTDIFTDIVVLLGLKYSLKPADQSHHYGHGKFETLSTLILSVVLIVAGTSIFLSGLKSLIHYFYGILILKPKWIAFYAAIISLIVKEVLFRYTIKIGKKFKSQAIIANAWHHRSDAFSSIGTTLGVLGAIILGKNWRLLDPLAAIIVSFFILKIAISILFNSINEFLEKSLDEKTEEKILKLISATSGVMNPHNLRTRKIGSSIAIDVHIEVRQHASVIKAHDISTEVEQSLKGEFGDGTFVSVHIEPSKNGGKT